MSWQPSMNWQHAKQRAHVLSQIRAFFLERNVIEVDTPLLSHATVTDVYLDAFITQFNYSQNSHCDESIPLYAQTSPEFSMKRLLASGYGCCYQICKAFRHEQHGRYHNPEFTMLEWYRIGFDHFRLMDEVAELMKLILACKNVEFISYQDLFKREVDMDPLITDKNELIALIISHDKLSDWLLEENSIDALLQFVMAELIEPCIGKEVPCFVYNFPASQASLAKISSTDPRVAERFECYFHGIELANGFHELTDVEQQKQRFMQDNVIRAQLGKVEPTIDENFISALEHGLPPCAGVALGIDRLIMLALSVNKIDQVITFPIINA
ncbi:elongation factor P--(R)-beta-lysine ligase [Colwellia sp. C1TZA3]|uniref:elongation factor P--(R)-beta-lysine ligase n=1 Tax=Colwellia sp. C1TZA3 TaxID=2508879 RepID=UPI0011B9A063|nr:elongation factor P--(R)-beta-lysine ligase [Colwellia sp. C1TZA3]TWX72978.1 elongation factor P--(R)-beta-lysine ligase [Colwellia sp. C1TZA3]